MAERYQVNDISYLDFRGSERFQNLGKLRVDSVKLVWKKQGGDKFVEVKMDDIVKIMWKKVPGRNKVGLQIKNESTHIFTGFRDQDVSWLAEFFHKSCGIPPEEQQLSSSSKKEATTSKLPCTRRNAGGKEKYYELRSSKKEASASKPPRFEVVKDDDGSRKMKEDSKSMDGFMLYSQLEWEKVKKDNPGIPCKDIGRVLLRRWHNMSAEDQKALHEAAEADEKFSSFTVKKPRSRTKKRLHRYS